MDLNAGRIADGEASIEDTGMALFRLLLEVASGPAHLGGDPTASRNALVLFNPAPVT